jgi:predicted tellurium resistance membrane protein TerC
MSHELGYVWPRAAIVLMAWAATYLLLTRLSIHVPPTVVYFTAIAWALAGVVCVGYIRKLRREALVAQRSVIRAEQKRPV